MITNLETKQVSETENQYTPQINVPLIPKNNLNLQKVEQINQPTPQG
jgi:hypothetical protein